MPKYAVLGGYTAETWARFIDNPGDRTEAVSRLCAAAGGKLDTMFFTFGEDDFLVIADLPDDAAAATVSLAAGSSGALRNLRTVKLIEMGEASRILEKAKTVRAAYVPPGAREPARV
jgi:uncharacterized protein with GYD domain